MTVVVQHLTNSAYGFPRGWARTRKPVALACLHVTANASTSAMAPAAGAQAEWKYANRAASPGPSASHYIARDGWTIEAIDWRRYAAWSNGDVSKPNTHNPGVQRVLALGGNTNEAYGVETESVGYGSKYPITAAQRQANAELIAEASRHWGLPVNRETVHGHWEINGVDRSNCPTPPANHEAFLRDVIARANAILAPSIGDPMANKPVTSQVQELIDWGAETPYFALDGTTRLGKSPGDTGRLSLFGCGLQRAVVLPNGALALITPTASHPIVTPVPVQPVDTSPFTQADKDKARLEGRAAAVAAAVAIQSKAATDIAAIASKAATDIAAI